MSRKPRPASSGRGSRSLLVRFAETRLAIVVPQFLGGGPPPALLDQRVQEGINLSVLDILGLHEPAAVPVHHQQIEAHEAWPDLRAAVRDELAFDLCTLALDPPRQSSACRRTPFPPRRRTRERMLSNRHGEKLFRYAIASTIAFKVGLGRIAFVAFPSSG